MDIINELEIAKSDIITILTEYPHGLPTDEVINNIGEKIISRIDEVLNKLDE